MPRRLAVIILILLLVAAGLLAGWLRRHRQPAAPSGSPATPAAGVGQWLSYRGDAALTGRATDQRIHLDVEPGSGKPLSPLWSYKAPDAIHSSPVIAQGLVFFGCDNKQVYALDALTGDRRWRFGTKAPVEASPLLRGGRLYIGATDGDFYALNAATGREIWSYRTGGKVAGAANRAVLPDGTEVILFGSYDANLYCLTASQGTLCWKYTTGSYVNGTPAIVAGDAGATTGPARAATLPAAAGRVVIGGCDNRLHIVALATGRGEASVDLGSYVAASPAVADGVAYIGQYAGRLLAVNLDHHATIWKFSQGDHPFFSSAAVAADRVVFGGRDRQVHALDRATGRECWSFTTRGEVDSSPVIADGKVIVGSDDGRLYILSLKDGRELWSYRVGPGIATAPAVVADPQGTLIVVTTDDGTVQAFAGRFLAPRRPN